jgi:putative transposase
MTAGDVVYHALNRANGRATIFENDGDYADFVRLMRETQQRVPMRILDYCLMPNHWHLILWPREAGTLSRFMGLLTNAHVHRWQAYRKVTGIGHLYQGRFKSFPVQSDGHFLTVCRYVERNPLKANLVTKAEQWRWSGLWERRHAKTDATNLLAPWPVPRPERWVEWVNEPISDNELAAIQECMQRGRPYGSDDWTAVAALSLGLAATLRPLGRPRKCR